MRLGRPQQYTRLLSGKIKSRRETFFHDDGVVRSPNLSQTIMTVWRSCVGVSPLIREIKWHCALSFGAWVLFLRPCSTDDKRLCLRCVSCRPAVIGLPCQQGFDRFEPQTFFQFSNFIFDFFKQTCAACLIILVDVFWTRILHIHHSAISHRQENAIFGP